LLGFFADSIEIFFVANFKLNHNLIRKSKSVFVDVQAHNLRKRRGDARDRARLVPCDVVVHAAEAKDIATRAEDRRIHAWRGTQGAASTAVDTLLTWGWRRRRREGCEAVGCAPGAALVLACKPPLQERQREDGGGDCGRCALARVPCDIREEAAGRTTARQAHSVRRCLGSLSGCAGPLSKHARVSYRVL
jgi:hypothetical protein